MSAKSKYSVSELGQEKFTGSREKAAVIPLFVQGKKKLTSSEIGTAIHVVMEKLDFKKSAEMFEFSEDKGYEYLANLVRELEEKVILTQDEANAIDLKRIAMFIKSDIGKRAAKADKIYKEVPFTIIKEIDGIEAIIQGIIDCYFEEGGEFSLVDYKSGYVSSGEDVRQSKEKYAAQIALYSEALEITKNIKVKDRYLYLFGRDTAVLI